MNLSGPVGKDMDQNFPAFSGKLDKKNDKQAGYEL